MASKKHLSQGEILQWARDLIDALKAGDSLDEFARRFADESASTRRDVMEGVCERLMKLQPYRFEPEGVLTLLERAFILGPGQKPDFHEKYYRTLFSCAAALAGEHKELICKRLFARLVLPAEKGESATQFALVALADSDPVMSGMNAILGDDSFLPLLEGAFDRWSALIPELAARGKERIGLSNSALSGILKIISAKSENLDSSIRLALPVLVGALGDVPDEFRVSRHARTEMSIRSSALASDPGRDCKGQSSSAPEVAAKNPGPQQAATVFTSGDVSRFSESLQQLLVQLDQGVAERLRTQANEIGKVREELAEVNALLAEKEKQVSALVFQKDRIHEQLEQGKAALAAMESDLSRTREELARYTQSHDVLVATSGSMERDVADRIKREFAEHSGAVLNEIRSYLDQLQRTPDANCARLAVSNFNRLARILQTQNFVSASSLPRIEVVDQTGDAN